MGKPIKEYIEKNFISKLMIKKIIEEHYPDIAIQKLIEILEEK